MLAGELQSRANKLKKEQQKRLEKEKTKAEKERALEALAKQRQKEREEEASRRRAAALAAAELVGSKHIGDTMSALRCKNETSRPATGAPPSWPPGK